MPRDNPPSNWRFYYIDQDLSIFRLRTITESFARMLARSISMGQTEYRLFKKDIEEATGVERRKALEVLANYRECSPEVLFLLN